MKRVVRPAAGVAGIVAALAFALHGAARADAIHIYSYDPADLATRLASGPLTFTFKKGLLHTTLLNLKSTEARASARLRADSESALGRQGLRPYWKIDATARDLYSVRPGEDGAALISALCPGSTRAWLAFTPVKLYRDLVVLVIGDTGTGRETSLCRTLRFSFHGEWRLPSDRSLNPDDMQPDSNLPGG